jgi:integrase
MATISAADVRKYIAHRRTATEIVTAAHERKRPDGRVIKIPERRRTITAVSNGEINRELTTLRRMFSLAIESERLLHAPYIAELEEDNVRQGFFEPEQFSAVLAHLPEAIRPVIQFAAITGWRIDSEVLTLEWRQVDFAARTVRLEPGTTKNREGRMFPFTRELRLVLQTQWAEQEELRKAGHLTPYVFVRMVAKGRGGDKSPKPITSFAKAWKTACTAAGCPGRIPHDFRRTAVRSLERAGVPRSVAMKLTGHKTESVYRRYAIVSEGDLTDAARKLDAAAGFTQAVARP